MSKGFRYLGRIIVELRRVLSLLFLPWVGILLFCFIASWYSLFGLGLDALVAPLLKVWLLVKPFIVKTLPAAFLWVWTHTGAKVTGWLSELAALLASVLGGWKAWSVKKLVRQSGRFFLSLSARFVLISVLLNLLFGHERRGIRRLPHYAMHRLRTTWLGRFPEWWSNSSQRRKRIVPGLLLCIVLVLAGQALLGVSVLLFDLLWELVLVVWRLVIRLWRALSPILFRIMPNFIGNFVTRTLLPMVVNVVPVVKDDHRVMYLRFSFRRHIRRIKAWLYLKSRARRGVVRRRITALVGDELRAGKTALLTALHKHGEHIESSEKPAQPDERADNS